MSKMQSTADGFSSVAKIGSLTDGSSPNIIHKGKQSKHHSPLHTSSATFEENPLKSRAYSRDMCLPVQNSIAEVGPFEIRDSTKSSVSVIGYHVSSSVTKSDTMSDHPQGDSGQGGPFLLWPKLSIVEENAVEDGVCYENKRPSKSRMTRSGQNAALKQNRLISGEEMKGSSGQFAACNRGPSSSSCPISKVLAEDMELQSRNMNGVMKDLRVVSCCETSSNYNNWPCHPPASKKPKINQSLVSETSRSPFEIENEKAKSEILFSGLHLLADVAIQFGWAGLPENSLAKEKEIRKAIFSPTGVPFLQKRVPRRAKSAFKHDLEKSLSPSAANSEPHNQQMVHDLERSPSAANSEPHDQQMVHDLEKSPSADNSEPLLSADIRNLGDPASIKQSESQVLANGANEDPMTIPHVRRSKRIRSQALTSKYCDFVLQPCKRGVRR